MLRIREEQVNVFRAERRAAFVRELASRARGELPRATAGLPSAELEARLDRALALAPARGLVTLALQERFALLALAAGEDALDDPRALAILDDEGASGRERLDRLEAWIRAQARGEEEGTCR